MLKLIISKICTVFGRDRIRVVEHLKEVQRTCWEQIIDRAIEQFRKRLSLVVAASGGHIEHYYD